MYYPKFFLHFILIITVYVVKSPKSVSAFKKKKCKEDPVQTIICRSDKPKKLHLAGIEYAAAVIGDLKDENRKLRDENQKLNADLSKHR